MVWEAIEMFGDHEFDWGIQLGMWGLILMILAAFEPTASPYFIVPAMVCVWIFFSAALLKGFWLYPFANKGKKKWSAVIVLFVTIAVGLYSWRIWPETTYEPHKLRFMSAADLKAAEKKLSDKMRDLQREHDNKASKAVTEITSTKDADQSQKAYAVLDDNLRSEFYKKYQGPASAINSEFLSRLDIRTTAEAEKQAIEPQLRIAWGSTDFSRALGGQINGPDPVSQCADYLDGLSRMLH
jgi:hypothetical protein